MFNIAYSPNPEKAMGGASIIYLLIIDDLLIRVESSDIVILCLLMSYNYSLQYFGNSHSIFQMVEMWTQPFKMQYCYIWSQWFIPA